MAKGKAKEEENYRWFLKASFRGHEGKWVAIKDKRVIEEGNTAKSLASRIKDRVDLSDLMLAKIPERNQVLIL